MDGACGLTRSAPPAQPPSKALWRSPHVPPAAELLPAHACRHLQAYQFFPTTLVDPTFDAINRCRFADKVASGADGQEVKKSFDGQVANDPHKQQAPDARAMGALLEKATLEKYKAGELVIEEGMRPRTLFNLAKGHVAAQTPRTHRARTAHTPHTRRIRTAHAPHAHRTRTARAPHTHRTRTARAPQTRRMLTASTGVSLSRSSG